ncbi:hypothetical protein [Nonomuraea jabiensis]|uniref:Uncharacterized protein n=1 Tax=Nonomuraea jabiensis TaxID=882448 RepID=A0A7W9GDI4_9ACTN|nr:hypothetical protein [Nonomuraea jabiensis]MBB5781626.1 hypothetical protein [Nonomuraea jabiensis]
MRTVTIRPPAAYIAPHLPMPPRACERAERGAPLLVALPAPATAMPDQKRRRTISTAPSSMTSSPNPTAVIPSALKAMTTAICS